MTTTDFSKIFSNFFEPKTPAQQVCTHLISAKMPDGKFYCPSCRLVSDSPLVQR